MSERHCLKCKHLSFDAGSPGYSDMTPGSPMRLRCGYGEWNERHHKHWWDAEDLYGNQSLAKAMESARECAHYEEESKP